MMDGITESLLWYVESLASDLQTLVRHWLTSQDNLQSYLIANFGLMMFSAQATKNLSTTVITAPGAKQTVDTKKMQYFVARDPEWGPASQIARKAFTRSQEKPAHSALSRVELALVLPTIARNAQMVTTKRTTRAWLNVGVVTILQVTCALNVTPRAAVAKWRQITARHVILLGSRKTRVVRQIVRLCANQLLYRKYVLLMARLRLRDALR